MDNKQSSGKHEAAAATCWEVASQHGHMRNMWDQNTHTNKVRVATDIATTKQAKGDATQTEPVSATYVYKLSATVESNEVGPMV